MSTTAISAKLEWESTDRKHRLPDGTPMMGEDHRVVFYSGVLAGVSLALKIQRLQKDVQETVFDRLMDEVLREMK